MGSIVASVMGSMLVTSVDIDTLAASISEEV